ncbi:fibronectin type III domain-containing protein [Algicola sagamiensis]|uniref:hypothetical protein n=1 Tax=Algicola sagamiensis TaxID=163869 RepID=UPI000380F444|nr:hypothetical protein [Algicola sagamiensis]
MKIKTIGLTALATFSSLASASNKSWIDNFATQLATTFAQSENSHQGIKLIEVYEHHGSGDTRVLFPKDGFSSQKWSGVPLGLNDKITSVYIPKGVKLSLGKHGPQIKGSWVLALFGDGSRVSLDQSFKDRMTFEVFKNREEQDKNTSVEFDRLFPPKTFNDIASAWKADYSGIEAYGDQKVYWEIIKNPYSATTLYYDPNNSSNKYCVEKYKRCLKYSGKKYFDAATKNPNKSMDYKIRWKLSGMPQIPTGRPVRADDNEFFNRSFTIKRSNEQPNYHIDYYFFQRRDNGGAWKTSRFNSTSQTQDLPEGTYDYRIKNCRFSTNNCGSYGPIRTVKVYRAPIQPTQITVNEPDELGNIQVSWAKTERAATYEVERQVNGGDWSRVYKGSELTKKFATIENNSKLKFRVRACHQHNNAGCSEFKEFAKPISVSFIPNTPRHLNATPDQVKLNKDSKATVKLTWAPVENAAYYLMTELQGRKQKQRVSQQSTELTVEINGPGQHQYKIEACNAKNKCSAQSSPVTVQARVQLGHPDSPKPIVKALHFLDAEETAKDVVLTWKKVPHATRYTVVLTKDNVTTKTPLGNVTTHTLTLSEGKYEVSLVGCNTDYCSNTNKSSPPVIAEIYVRKDLTKLVRQALYFDQADQSVSAEEHNPSLHIYSPYKAAFRYKHLMYRWDPSKKTIVNAYAQGSTSLDFTSLYHLPLQVKSTGDCNLEGNYAQSEECLTYHALDMIQRNLTPYQDGKTDWHELLIDLFYDRAVAKVILGNKKIDEARISRFREESIEMERELISEASAIYKEALSQYWKLFSDDNYRKILVDLTPTRGLISPKYYDEDNYSEMLGSDEALFEGWKDLTLLYQLMAQTAESHVKLAKLNVTQGQVSQSLHGVSAHQLETLLETLGRHHDCAVGTEPLSPEAPRDLQYWQSLVPKEGQKDEDGNLIVTDTSKFKQYINGWWKAPQGLSSSCPKSQVAFPNTNLMRVKGHTGLPEALTRFMKARRQLKDAIAWMKGDINILGLPEDAQFIIYPDRQDSRENLDSYVVLSEKAEEQLNYAIDSFKIAAYTYDNYKLYQDKFYQSVDIYQNELSKLLGVQYHETCLDTSIAGDCFESADMTGSDIGLQQMNIIHANQKLQEFVQQINSVKSGIEIEIRRRAQVAEIDDHQNYVRLDYGQKQMDITRQMTKIQVEAAERRKKANKITGAITTATRIVAAVYTGGASEAAYQAARGAAAGVEGAANTLTSSMMANSDIRAIREMGALKELSQQLALEEQAQLVAGNGEKLDIESEAKIKHEWLRMNTLLLQLGQAELQIYQETERLIGMYRRANYLISHLTSSTSPLAKRYYADPIHTRNLHKDFLSAEKDFEHAQKWVYFAKKSLEYRQLDAINLEQDLFQIRTAKDLRRFFIDLKNTENNSKIPESISSTISIKENVLGLFDYPPTLIDEDYLTEYETGEDEAEPQLYMATPNGVAPYYDEGNEGDGSAPEALEASEAFKHVMKKYIRVKGRGRRAQVWLEIPFSTTNLQGMDTFFEGPLAYKLDEDKPSSILCVSDGDEGIYGDRINKVAVNLLYTDTTIKDQTTVKLSYGGNSYLRSRELGQVRVDHQGRPYTTSDEIMAYPSLFWRQDNNGGFYPSRNIHTQFIGKILNEDSNVPKDNFAYTEQFFDRPVAATDWKLSVLIQKGRAKYFKLDDLEDINVVIQHNYFNREKANGYDSLCY